MFKAMMFGGFGAQRGGKRNKVCGCTLTMVQVPLRGAKVGGPSYRLQPAVRCGNRSEGTLRVQFLSQDSAKRLQARGRGEKSSFCFSFPVRKRGKACAKIVRRVCGVEL